jgi:glycerol-3-phosphate acyltransferase PlsX
MRIAVDAMGGDNAPREIIKGAFEAASGLSLDKVILVGDEVVISKEIDQLGLSSGKVEIYHASEVIAMGEKPAMAVRRKKDSSIGRAIDLVKSGDADAVVSAGNTGAVVAASTLKLRTLEGVERPTIAAVMPTQDRPFILTDAGANLDCNTNLMRQFAVMGSVYAKEILGAEEPVVGLLSIGGEEGKGNEITREMFSILSESSLNFRGNVEGHDLFEGHTDVVVCDGFIGNIVLKTTESVVSAVAHWMKQEFKKNPLRCIGSILLFGAMKEMKTRLDPEMYGGAPLLGVNGICVITHGSSTSKAIYHAIRVAAESVDHHINELIVKEIARNCGDKQ